MAPVFFGLIKPNGGRRRAATPPFVQLGQNKNAFRIHIHTAIVATTDVQGLPAAAAIPMMDGDESGRYQFFQNFKQSFRLHRLAEMGV